MEFTQNTIGDKWYKIHTEMTNCGSYAFNILEWYSPWPKRESAETFIDRKLNSDYSNLPQLVEQIMEMCTERILQDFASKNIVKISDPRQVHQDQDVVAFRIAAVPGDKDNFTETDFHFRVCRDGRWTEKVGSKEIRECGFSEDNWPFTHDIEYDSPIIYFVKDR